MDHSINRSEGEIDLIEYLRVLWRYKASIVGAASIAAAAMVGISFAIPSTYRAEVLIAPAAEGGEGSLTSSSAAVALGTLGGIIGSGVLPSSTRATDEHLAVLRSRSFVWRFVEEQQLMPELFADEWDAAATTWRDPENAPQRWDAYELIIEDGLLSIVPHEDSGLFTLAVEWSDPEKAALWANTLVVRLNWLLRERERERTESILAYLNEELEHTQVAEVRQSLFSLITRELNNAMLVNTQNEYAFRILDPAVPPEKAISPKRILIAMVTGILAGVAAIFVAFVREGARRQQATLN